MDLNLPGRYTQTPIYRSISLRIIAFDIDNREHCTPYQIKDA